MADDSRDGDLREHFDRLGRAVRSAMLEDPRIRRELQVMRRSGWDALVDFEARLVATDRTGDGTKDAREISFSVTPGTAPQGFQLDAEDVAWLREIGITAGRYRSTAGVRRTSGHQR